MRAVRKRNLIILFAVILIGCIYAVFVKLTGIGIPCPIRTVTKLQCPGCGVSRMCMAAIRLDFKTAFEANPFVFVTLPYILYEIFCMVMCINRKSKVNNALEIIYVIAAIVFAVIRNIK